MMPVYEATESDFELIPEGAVVPCKVIEIELKQLDFGPRLNWKFEITDGEHQGFKINDGTSPKFSVDPPSKLYEWACMLLGRTFEVGDNLDTDDLIGLPCRVEVGHKPDREDPKKMWMRAETVMPPRSASASSAEDVFG
jgi:hypothetical protein